MLKLYETLISMLEQRDNLISDDVNSYLARLAYNH
jgi:hypothetical protein